MPRQSHTAFSVLGPKSNVYTAGAADITMQAADASNFEEVTHDGALLVIAHNTGAGAQTVTIESIVDERGRTGEITTYSLAAGDYAVFGPFDLEGWEQADGNLDFKGSHADVKMAVVSLGNYI